MHDPELLAVLESTVGAAVGGAPRILGVETLDSTPQWSVLTITLRDRETQLLAEVAPPHAGRAPAPPPADVERTATATATAMAMAMAGAAGVPVAEVLAAHTARAAGERSYLLHRFVDGTEWRRVAPALDDADKGAVHRQLAEGVLALQSVSLPAFGELGAEGSDIRTALVHRCELRVTDPRRRAWFRSLLARELGSLALPRKPASRLGRPPRRRARSCRPRTPCARRRTPRDRTRLLYQLLWCLEYPDDGPRQAGTAALCRDLGVGEPSRSWGRPRPRHTWRGIEW